MMHEHKHHYHDHGQMMSESHDFQDKLHDACNAFEKHVEEEIKRGHLTTHEWHEIAQTFEHFADAKEALVSMSHMHKECEHMHHEMHPHKPGNPY